MINYQTKNIVKIWLSSFLKMLLIFLLSKICSFFFNAIDNLSTWGNRASDYSAEN